MAGQSNHLGIPMVTVKKPQKESHGSKMSLKSLGSTSHSVGRVLHPTTLFDFTSSKTFRKNNPSSRRKDRSNAGPPLTLQQAARDGRYDIVKNYISIIGKDKKRLNKKDECNTTALHYAVRYNHFSIVQLLISNGANVNAEGDDGATPLHYAARYQAKHSRMPKFEPFHSRPAVLTKKKDIRLKSLRNWMVYNSALNRRQSDEDVAEFLRVPESQKSKKLKDKLGTSPKSSFRKKEHLKSLQSLAVSSRSLGSQSNLKRSKSSLLAVDNSERIPLLRAESWDSSTHPAQSKELPLPNVISLSRAESESSFGGGSMRDAFSVIDLPMQGSVHSIVSDKGPEIIIVGDLTEDERERISSVDALVIPAVHTISDPVTRVRNKTLTISLPDIQQMTMLADDEQNGSDDVEIASLFGESHQSIPEPSAAKPSIDETPVFPSPQPLRAEHHLKTSPKHRHLQAIRDHLRAGSESILNALKTQPLYDGMRRDQSILLFLLKNRANVNATDFYGETPLHYATLRGNITAAQELLAQKDLQLEAIDKTMMTALHCACNNGAINIAALLIKHGASLMCLDEEDMTPLHFAAMEGHLDVIHLLFQAAEVRGGWMMISKMILAQDRDGQTALHLAVENGHIDIVRVCLDKGANVNSVQNNMITPLHLAATNGQLEIVHVLFVHGADMEAKNALQETPLHRAALLNRIQIVEYLLDRGANIDCRDKDKETPLMMAVRKNNIETVRLLISKNADVTVKDADDKTCLYIAAEEDCVEALMLLLRHCKGKSLIEEFDTHENTPLHVSSMKGYIKIVKLLLDSHACIDAKNDQNITPLHLAAKYGRARIVRMLLEIDNSLVIDEDDASNTPLHLAAEEGHNRVVQILLEGGAAVDARNANLWTPLDCAASRGYTKTAAALLDGDSPIDPMDKSKTTPLHLAAKEGHTNMVLLLLSNKANISRKDHQGRNCLDIAIEYNQKDVAMAILNDPHWKWSMRNSTFEDGSMTTPVRKMIKKMPDVAEKVFNQCIVGNNVAPDHPSYEVTCFYEFLEDASSDWGPNFLPALQRQLTSAPSVAQAILGDNSRKHHTPGHHLPLPWYSREQFELKKNHPLMIMVQSQRAKLLCHPLVSCLLRHKWRSYGRYVYYSKLLLYAIFLVFLTGYAISTVKLKHELVTSIGSNNETTIKCTMTNEPNDFGYSFWVRFGRYAVGFLAALSILMELFLMCTQLHNYLRIHNGIEFGSYILSFLYILDSFTWGGKRIEIVEHGRCGVFHRSLGALAIWMSWISLVMFMRKFPKLGIYVVMFTDILKTFAQFFIVFVLFIIAFGLGFHMLLFQQEPISFRTPARAILKTTMGMLGEFEYDTVFNDSSVNNQPMPMAWLIYVLYLVVNCIILMNLLVGLAVDDIKGVQENAVLKRLAMQVELALDVEKALPLWLRQRVMKTEEIVMPNESKRWSFWSFWTLQTTLLRAPRVSAPQQTPIEKLQKQQTELKHTVATLKGKLKSLHTQNHRMETMMSALLKHHNITVEYEVDDEEDDALM